MARVMRPVEPVALRGGVKGTIRARIDQLGPRSVVVAETLPGPRRGALAQRDGDSLAHAAEQARRLRLPLVIELASSGADVSGGIDALHGWGGAAAAVAACSGVVPIVVSAGGPVVSGPALLLGLADVVVMTPAAVAYVSGPTMVASFTGVRLSPHALGGASIHAAASGVCTIQTDDARGAVEEVLSFLPDHCDAEPPCEPFWDPVTRRAPDLRALVPTQERASYDVRDVVRCVVDDAESCELWPLWASQLVTAFARLGGRPVGIVANQPRSLAGTLDISASQKGARFVRLCDTFNVPIVTFVDTPGFLPGKDLEWRGMIRHGAELAFAYAQATVPRICVILRKAFGGAYIVMDSKGLGNDVCFAWPQAEIAVMGAAGAVQILHRRTSEDARRRREDAYRERFLTPWAAAERGFVDAVIDPEDTRAAVVGALEQLATKREWLIGRKHDSGPL